MGHAIPRFNLELRKPNSQNSRVSLCLAEGMLRVQPLAAGQCTDCTGEGHTIFLGCVLKKQSAPGENPG